MHINDIIKGLENGSITIDTGKHKLTDLLGCLKEQAEHSQRSVDNYEAKIAGTKKLDDFDKKKELIQTLNYFKSQQNFEIGKFPLVIGFEDAYCFDCGCKLRPILMSENVIKLIEPSRYFKLSEKKDVILQDSDFIDCEIYPTRQKGFLETEIDVPSGNFIFANRFHGEAFEDTRPNRYDRTGSINAIIGGFDYMNFHAKKNIAYCQTSNMDVAVYVNDTGDDVIISDAFGFDGSTEDEYDISFDGFTCIGKFHCATWCWEGADVSVLKKLKPIHPQIPARITPKNDKHRDVIRTKLQKGRWNIKHYMSFMDDGYGFHKHPEDVKPGRNPIYSRLTLIK